MGAHHLWGTLLHPWVPLLVRQVFLAKLQQRKRAQRILTLVILKYICQFFDPPPFQRWSLIPHPLRVVVLSNSLLTDRPWQKWLCNFQGWLIKGICGFLLSPRWIVRSGRSWLPSSEDTQADTQAWWRGLQGKELILPTAMEEAILEAISPALVRPSDCTLLQSCQRSWARTMRPNCSWIPGSQKLWAHTCSLLF